MAEGGALLVAARVGPTMGSDPPSHRLFAAVYDPTTWIAERTLFQKHREYLVRDLHGRVLDLGAGTGATFPYFRQTATDAPDLELHAIDPDPHMRRRARRKARDLGLEVEIREDGAGDLSYPDDHFDVVVASLVLCTVPDVSAAVDEVARVLKPGGEFRFFEHVHATGLLGGFQTAIDPAWNRAAAGCNLDRETGTVLRDDDRFEVVDFEEFAGVPPVHPLIRGTLRRRGP